MKKFTLEILGATSGVAVAGAVVSIFQTGTQTIVPLYMTNSLVGPAHPNPFTSDDGVEECYVPDGTYDILVVRGTRQTLLQDQEIYDLDELSALAHTNFDPLIILMNETQDAIDGFNASFPVKVATFDDNAAARTLQFNNNATTKTAAFDAHALEQQALSRAYAVSDTDVSIPGAVSPADRGAKFWSDKTFANYAQLPVYLIQQTTNITNLGNTFLGYIAAHP